MKTLVNDLERIIQHTCICMSSAIAPYPVDGSESDIPPSKRCSEEYIDSTSTSTLHVCGGDEGAYSTQINHQPKRILQPWKY